MAGRIGRSTGGLRSLALTGCLVLAALGACDHEEAVGYRVVGLPQPECGPDDWSDKFKAFGSNRTPERVSMHIRIDAIGSSYGDFDVVGIDYFVAQSPNLDSRDWQDRPDFQSVGVVADDERSFHFTFEFLGSLGVDEAADLAWPAIEHGADVILESTSHESINSCFLVVPAD